MLKSGIYDFVICRGGTDMCFILGFGRKCPDLKQYRISGLTTAVHGRARLGFWVRAFDTPERKEESVCEGGIGLGVSRRWRGEEIALQGGRQLPGAPTTLTGDLPACLSREKTHVPSMVGW